jgi:hypothetical protein
MEPSAVSAGLARVMAHGAPAQRAEAIRLAVILESAPMQPDTIAAAEQLIDAYLNDPYLERSPAPAKEA